MGPSCKLWPNYAERACALLLQRLARTLRWAGPAGERAGRRSQAEVHEPRMRRPATANQVLPLCLTRAGGSSALAARAVGICAHAAPCPMLATNLGRWATGCHTVGVARAGGGLGKSAGRFKHDAVLPERMLHHRNPRRKHNSCFVPASDHQPTTDDACPPRRSLSATASHPPPPKPGLARARACAAMPPGRKPTAAAARPVPAVGAARRRRAPQQLAPRR